MSNFNGLLVEILTAVTSQHSTDAVLLSLPPRYELRGYCQVVPTWRSREVALMHIPTTMSRLKGFRFPREIIAYAVWVYRRFALSTADVDDLLVARGVIVSQETVRLWANRFGQHSAGCIRRDRPLPRDKWHMGEAVIIIRGKNHRVWRARRKWRCVRPSRASAPKPQSATSKDWLPNLANPGSSSPTDCELYQADQNTGTGR